MYNEFSSELARDDNRTYPQEAGMTRVEFEAYYFARDVIVALLGVQLERQDGEGRGEGEGEGGVSDGGPEDGITLEHDRGEVALERERKGRSWIDCVAGFYYVRTLFSLFTFSLAEDNSRNDDVTCTLQFTHVRSNQTIPVIHRTSVTQDSWSSTRGEVRD